MATAAVGCYGRGCCIDYCGRGCCIDCYGRRCCRPAVMAPGSSHKAPTRSPISKTPTARSLSPTSDCRRSRQSIKHQNVRYIRTASPVEDDETSLVVCAVFRHAGRFGRETRVPKTRKNAHNLLALTSVCVSHAAIGMCVPCSHR